MYDAQKAKGLLINEISKISSIDLTTRCFDSKRPNVMMNMKPNEKLQSYVIKLQSYAYFYNWDESHYLVLIVYVLVEFIIEASHYTKDYLILISTHFTQVYVQWMSYSFVWLYLIKYVFACSIFVNQAQKYFWVF